MPPAGRKEFQIFAGDSLRVVPLDGGLVELCFDRRGESINKLDDRTVNEFRQAVDAIAAHPGIRGVLVTNAKEVFIVGADITEFGRKFRCTSQEVARDVLKSNQIFVAFEDLVVPTVIAINGFALGGGLELALAGAIRVMSDAAQVGVPEVKLGLFPGFGGTVRLARVAGTEVALEWITSGRSATADQALACGVVDVTAAPARRRDDALALLWRCIEGQVDWRSRQQRKRMPVAQSPAETDPIYEQVLGRLRAQAARHQPAGEMAVVMMREACAWERMRALELEAAAFGAVTQTRAAKSMVQTFLNDQAVKKLARQQGEGARNVRQAAVIGAGIMGGGIAYTSALRGIPVRMKDISPAALEAGMGEARRQLARQMHQGKLTQSRADAVLASITPQIDDRAMDGAELVIEAVAENLSVKHKVLAELEQSIFQDAVLASNTSSLRINDIAAHLARPQNVVGLHFFNPVPVMPLVEVVRGSRSSASAVATATAYVSSLGKTPIVVKDCPGFLVNRILTPYIIAFCNLVADGADFERIDWVMEAFGWPMGPAYLEDVVGMDTCSHVIDVISAGYPQRMQPPQRNAIRALVRGGRLGQKSGRGFYDYDAAEGKPRKSPSRAAKALMTAVQRGAGCDLDDEAIVERMMLPMLLEAIRTLEEGVVATAAELDMAMLLGVGFPAYLGGPLKYADWLGAPLLLKRCEALAAHGPACEAPAMLRDMAATGQSFYRD